MVNAIQATAPGGLVVAAVEGHGDRVQIRVYDTGCGIPADRLQAVFEDFVTTKRRGLGLGLAITRKIVEQLGGRISVASEVGKGTTFVIDFPRTSARPMAQAAAMSPGGITRCSGSFCTRVRWTWTAASTSAHYFEQKTARGARRFSCEVVLDAGDRIILDDDSLTSLQAKVARLAPATIYSRALASRRRRSPLTPYERPDPRARPHSQARSRRPTSSAGRRPSAASRSAP